MSKLERQLNPPAIVREDQEVRFTYGFVVEHLEKMAKHYRLHAEGKCLCPLLSADATRSLERPMKMVLVEKLKNGFEVSKSIDRA